jgi:hypothetical protein
MNLQHFQGSGGDGNGRMRIELAPEVVPDMDKRPDNNEKQQPESDSGQEPDPGQEPRL